MYDRFPLDVRFAIPRAAGLSVAAALLLAAIVAGFGPAACAADPFDDPAPPPTAGPTIPNPNRGRTPPLIPDADRPFQKHVVPDDRDEIPRDAPRRPLIPGDGLPERQPVDPAARPPHLPEADDFTAAALRAAQDDLRSRFGGDHEIPLAVKAEYLEWVMRRYHLTGYNQVHHTVALPKEPGDQVRIDFGDDVSTWNGALLAAMSYKYAVTRNPETLDLIVRLVDGLHFFQEVTGRRGLVARCVMQSNRPVLRATRKYVAPDRTVFYYRSDAAKGTYNQIVAGYAVMLMLVGDDLPDETSARARRDLTEMAIHLIDNDYQITEADGKKTEYGDLRPLIGPVSVPFNAQVAYLIVAAANQFPGGDPIQKKMIRREFERLREKHHVYYEDPRMSLLPPQAVGNSPLVKGTNDRNHLHNAAYVGLMLELYAASKQRRPRDAKFLFELGQTMAWTMQDLQAERNSLCAFMWNGLLRDREVFQAIVPRDQPAASRQAQFVLSEGVEQLRRAPIDRFHHPGKHVETRSPQWLDVQRHDEVYYWKCDSRYRWEVTGPPGNLLNCGIDYLHAYWLMRYFGLAEG